MTMNVKARLLVAAALMSLGASGAFAAGDHAQHAAATAGASATAMAMTSGEVRKVDIDQAKVTLKHEAISNLDMPPMTMVFRAQSADLLKNLKPGDKVRFHAENSGGAIVVTHIQAE